MSQRNLLQFFAIIKSKSDDLDNKEISSEKQSQEDPGQHRRASFRTLRRQASETEDVKPRRGRLCSGSDGQDGAGQNNKRIKDAGQHRGASFRTLSREGSETEDVKPRRGRLRSGSDGQDGAGQNNKRIKVQENSHQFRKQMDNTHDARILDVWLRARESIGHIQGPKPGGTCGGTGFRVGKDYIMTAYHVAADLAKEHDSDDEDWSLLDAEDVFIEFKFPKQYVGEQFQFKPKLILGDKKLDYAILKLKPRTTHQLEIPKPFTKFQKIHYNELFSLLGFPQIPNDQIMQFDSDIVLFNLYADDNANRRGYMMDDNGKVKEGYKGIRDQRKVLFDCWVQHGASGAPGIVVGKNFEEPVCTLMLSRGFPVYAFTKGVNVPRNKMIEQGIKMEHIAKDIARKSGKELKRKIFGDCFH